MSTLLVCSADLGYTSAGLSTVGFRVISDAGAEVIARTTSGVTNVLNGIYQASFTVADDFKGLVYWDTTLDGPVYATERIDLTVQSSILPPEGLDGVEVEPGINMRQAMSLCLSTLVGVLSGVGNPSGQVTVDAAGQPGTPRVVYLTTQSGNRLAVTLLPPS